MIVQLRSACRAVLLTPKDEILLIKIANPNGQWVGWITPGGGINDGEHIQGALKRELFEECGLTQFKVEGQIWKRRMTFEWDGKLIDQAEDFFLIRIDRFELPLKHNLTFEEASYIKEFRWWTVDEISQSNETFAPTALPKLLRELIQHGMPKTPSDAGA
jgi:ADP-ribose pyrophosphatase YjhB (NUDIX family)